MRPQKTDLSEVLRELLSFLLHFSYTLLDVQLKTDFLNARSGLQLHPSLRLQIQYPFLEKLHCQIEKESGNSYDSDTPWKNIWQWQMEIINPFSSFNTTQIFLILLFGLFSVFKACNIKKQQNTILKCIKH